MRRGALSPSLLWHQLSAFSEMGAGMLVAEGCLGADWHSQTPVVPGRTTAHSFSSLLTPSRPEGCFLSTCKKWRRKGFQSLNF